MAFAVADRLVEQGMPFVFASGCDESVIRPRFANVVRYEKPLGVTKVIREIGRAIRA